jgi:hypothetical protein
MSLSQRERDLVAHVLEDHAHSLALWADFDGEPEGEPGRCEVCGIVVDCKHPRPLGSAGVGTEINPHTLRDLAERIRWEQS